VRREDIKSLMNPHPEKEIDIAAEIRAMNESHIRLEFEQWAKGKNWPLTRSYWAEEHDLYADGSTQAGWLAWQAAYNR
jgi:hypothetical protein